MKILITGQTGLARALSVLHTQEQVTQISRSTGHDISNIRSWGAAFLDHDLVYNCAYHNPGQLSTLEFFYEHWKRNPKKTIINIGSRVTYFPRTDTANDYSSYKSQKHALQSAFEQMIATALCDIKLINPGPIDTAMVAHLDVDKFDPIDLANKIRTFVFDRTIKRVDLWV